MHANWLSNADLGTYSGASGGDMMLVNGATSVQRVWYQSVVVQPNRSYTFSGWVVSALQNDPALASLTIGLDLSGACAGDPPIGTLAAVMPAGVWSQDTGDFNSGASADICLVLTNSQLAAGGNDFALDDLTLTLNPNAPSATTDAAHTPIDTPVTIRSAEQ